MPRRSRPRRGSRRACSRRASQRCEEGNPQPGQCSPPVWAIPKAVPDQTVADPARRRHQPLPPPTYERRSNREHLGNLIRRQVFATQPVGFLERNTFAAEVSLDFVAQPGATTVYDQRGTREVRLCEKKPGAGEAAVVVASDRRSRDQVMRATRPVADSPTPAGGFCERNLPLRRAQHVVPGQCEPVVDSCRPWQRLRLRPVNACRDLVVVFASPGVEGRAGQLRRVSREPTPNSSERLLPAGTAVVEPNEIALLRRSHRAAPGGTLGGGGERAPKSMDSLPRPLQPQFTRGIAVFGHLKWPP